MSFRCEGIDAEALRQVLLTKEKSARFPSMKDIFELPFQA